MKKVKKIITVSGIFILIGVGLFMTNPQRVQAQTVSITGSLLEPDLATAVASATVYLHNASYSYQNYGWTDENGFFELYDVVAGNYTLEIWAYDDTYFDPEPFNIYYDGIGVHALGTLLLQEAAIQVSLTLSDGVTAVPNYYVYLHDDSYSIWMSEMTNASGVASFGLNTYGTYTVAMWDKYAGESPPDEFTITYNGSQISMSKLFKAPNVYGYIKKPGGATCDSSECSINFWDNNWLHSYYASPDENGYFSLNINYSATYFYRIDYWGSENYNAPEESTVSIKSGQNNNLGNLFLVTPNITGKFVDQEGNGIANAWVDFHSANWMYYRGDSTADDGTFGFSVSTNGTYYVDFWIDSWTYPDYAAPATQTVTYSGAAVNLGNIEVGTPAMKLKVTNAAGEPLTWANVDVHDSNWSMNGSYWGSTDESGVAVINKSLSSGNYYVRVNPPWDAEGLISSDEILVSLTQGTTNLTYYNTPIKLGTAKKTITGTVKYPDGQPVDNASIDTWAMGGMYGGFAHGETNANGQYSFLVGAGEYQVNIWPNWGMEGEEPDWGSPGPQVAEFNESNSVAETETINFIVAEYNAILKGKVVMPDGTAVTNDLQISIDAWEKAGFTGNWDQADSNGNFSLNVAGGRTYEVHIWSWGMMGDSEYSGPTINPTKVGDGATVNLGTLRLVEKTSTVTGKVTDTNGQPLEGQYIDAWATSAMGWGSTMTDSEGDYSLKLFPGNYMINANPSWEQSESGASYVAIQPPQEVSALANSTTPNINFQLGIADATIKGHLEDSDGNLISGVWGWVNASNSRDTYMTGDMWYGGGMLGGPLNGGQFEIKVPAGKYSLNVFMDWNGDYTQESEVTVNIESGDTKDDVVITMLPNNATIEGKFVDTEGNTVNNIWGEVFAKRPEGGSAYGWIEWNGTYSMRVAAGTWNLNYYIDPYSGAAYLPSNLEEKSVTVGEDETLTLNFTLLEVDSEISGVVQDQSGQAIEGAHVFASLDYAGYERDTAYDHYGFNSMEATSDVNGAFSIFVPEGEYYLNASLPPELGYIFTGAQLVYTSPNEPAENVVVVFESANSQITGTVSLDGSENEAFIYAYTDTGGYSETTTSDGEFILPVISGETWVIGAVDEQGNSYYLSDQQEVEVADEAGTQEDLELEYQGEMPDPVSTTFDATVAKNIELSDGMQLEIPARALDTENNVTVTVEPTADMPYQAGAQPLAGYGYELEARDSNGGLISNFNSNVTLVLPYDEDIIDDIGLNEEDVGGEYFNTTSGVWQEPTSNITDEANNTLTVATNHFSAFSAVAPGRSMMTAADQDTLTVNLSNPVNNAIVTSDSVLVSGTVSNAGAIVTIRLNGVSVGAVVVDESGSFTSSVSGLVEGNNAIAVDAVLGLLSASTVERTVVYAGEDGSAIDAVTNIQYDIVVMTNEDSSPHVRVFDTEGNLVSQFFAFSQSYRGEFRVITADVDGDNQMEIIVYPYGDGYGPQVRIFEKDGTWLAQTMVLNEGYRQGIALVNNIDIDQDGSQDFVIVPRGQGGVNLRAYKYNADTESIDLLAWTMAYEDTYQGEVNMATADVTGDGNINIIISPLDGGPNVRIYSYDSDTQSLELDGWFMAYQEEFRQGVLVATGDVNGDGTRDIITYPEENGGPNIRAYTYNSETTEFELINWIEPYSDTYRGSLSVKVADLDKDGQSEIITVPATNGGPNLRVYSYDAEAGTFELMDWEIVYADDFRGGVGIAVSNLDGDDYREVVVYPLKAGGPNVRVYEYDAEGSLTLMDWALAYAEDFRGEMSVKVADLDGDGVSSLVITPLNEGGPNLRIFDIVDEELTLSSWFMAYNESFRGGVLTKFIN
ncbi:VCBS repeat-containing protein [Patescibacteria group bacterium]|nr:VCBS repeat-containing protein [Patescibacteria group bacterium]